MTQQFSVATVCCDVFRVIQSIGSVRVDGKLVVTTQAREPPLVVKLL